MAGFEPIDSHISQTEAAEPTIVQLTTFSAGGGLTLHSWNSSKFGPAGTHSGWFDYR